MENLIDKYLKEKMPATALFDQGHYKQILFNYEEWRQGQNLPLDSVSQQRELLIAFDTMREFDIKHDDIEESIDYFLKHKESYL
jgi:hypothetical protein